MAKLTLRYIGINDVIYGYGYECFICFFDDVCWNREVHVDLEQPEDRKKLKEYCSEKETYNCIYENNNNVYPLCALDFTPYDDNLKDDPECHPVYGKVWVRKHEIKKFPKENPKYWTFGDRYIARDPSYMVIDALIVGFLGINFVVVGAAIVAVIAELV
uniref:Uncharacterized protein n=1 Tax=Meloidogyne floridensis TaxID=298350 RepID=A0A915NNW4_9BILA